MNADAHRLIFDRCRGMVVAVAECARSAGKSGAGERRGTARRHAAFAFGLLTAVGATAQVVLPSGGAVVRGAGTIQVDGKSMLINQSTARMVADWTSFSIGSDASVRFVQPSTGSVALNRVLGDQPSAIFGSLSANGHVFLQNPSGVLFAPGAQVNVGSLVATTLQADPTQFMAGHLRLSNGGGAASGDVVNEGHITASQGGHVLLAGPRLANRGSIEAPGGTVAMAAGQTVTVDATGAGLLDIRVPVSAIGASLQNSGRLVADGGAVNLQVAAADAARRTVMQVDGLVRAHRVESRGGQIFLSGGDNGVVNVTGTLDASGAAGERGGSATVLGQQVVLAGQARLDASGDVGGGTLLVGGNFRGQGPEANSQATFVGRDVTLDASARDAGDGGKVVVWSDVDTTFKGRIAATGGTRSGDGGLVEVSGKQRLNFDGDVSTLAVRGRNGTLLLDPADLEIGFVADVNGDNTTGDDLPGNSLGAGDFGTKSYITSARVASLLFNGNVTLEASNSLTVTAPLTVTPGGAITTLSLFSPQVGIYAPISLSNAALTVNTNQNTGDSILVAADVRSLKTISLTSSDIFIDDALLSAFNVNLSGTASSGASIGQTSASSIVATNLTIAQPLDATLSVALDSTLNQATRLNVSAHDASITLNTLSGTSLDVRGAVDASLDLKTAGITQNIGPLSVGGAFTLTSMAGNVVMTHPANDFGGLVTFDVAGDIHLASSAGLYATGIADGDIALEALGGRFTMGGDISTLCSCSTIDIRGVGFFNDPDVGGLLLGPAGSRFFVRSSDWTQDQLGPLNLGSGLHDINYVVYNGWRGADPASGNGYYTNRDAFAIVPAADAPPVSLVYNGLTTFAHTQTGSSGSIHVDIGEGTSLLEALASYSVSSTGTFFNKNVGTDKGYTVAASTDIVATGVSGATYYGLNVPGFTRAAGPWQSGAPGNAISEVTPLAVTVGGVRAVDRAYNGLTTVALDVSAALLPGTIAGDSIGLSGGSGNMLDKNVGVAKPVALASLTFGGADAGNYAFSLSGVLSVNISPLTLAVSGMTAANKVYDATTAATITGSPTITPPLANDIVLVGGTLGAAFADKHVGVNKPVLLTGLTLSGADAGNYVIGAGPSLTATITPRPLVLSGVAIADKVYDATTAATLMGTPSASPLAGDVVTFSGPIVASFADKNVGQGKAVTVSGFSLGGADGGNYAAVLPTGLTASITPYTLLVSGLVASGKVYDATTAATVTGSPSVTPLAQDVVSVSGVFSASFADKNAGVAKPVTLTGLTLGGADAGNYTVGLTSSLTATITPYALALSGITVQDKVYDATNVGAVAGAPVVTPLPGDDVAVSGTGIATFDTKNVGDAKPAAISGFTLTGVDAPNYSLLLPTTLSASTTPRPIAPTGIRAIDRAADNSNTVQLNTSQAALPGVLPGDTVALVLNTPFGLVDSPTPGVAKPVTLVGFSLSGVDAPNYSLNLRPVSGGPGVVAGSEVSVTLNPNLQQRFEELRFNEYLQAVSDAQEPFRRAMAEALAAGFGKENIRKRLSLGLVFETGLAAPAIESIQPARAPGSCTVASGAGASLSCP